MIVSVVSGMGYGCLGSRIISDILLTAFQPPAPGIYRRGPQVPLDSLSQSKTKYSRSVALSEYIPPAKIHRPCFLNLAQ